MAFSLGKKVAIITGGSSGIGLAIAQRFRAHGAKVLIADRRPDGAGRAEEIGAQFQQTDVAQEAEVEAMFAAAKRLFGRVDILVNNAGIQPLGVSFDGLTQALMTRTLEVNVQGVAFGIKHAGRALADGGRVINLASFSGITAAPDTSIYAASKAAVIHLSKLGAIELARRRITVNAISPGTIRTPAVTDIPNNPEIRFIEERTPLRRLGEPEEVAALAHFIASDEAAYLTGQNIVLDGGLTLGWTANYLTPPANVKHGGWHE